MMMLTIRLKVMIMMRKKSSMNLHGVFLHVLGDAIGSVAVIVSALMSHFIDQDW